MLGAFQSKRSTASSPTSAMLNPSTDLLKGQSLCLFHQSSCRPLVLHVFSAFFDFCMGRSTRTYTVIYQVNIGLHILTYSKDGKTVTLLYTYSSRNGPRSVRVPSRIPKRESVQNRRTVNTEAMFDETKLSACMRSDQSLLPQSLSFSIGGYEFAVTGYCGNTAPSNIYLRGLCRSMCGIDLDWKGEISVAVIGVRGLYIMPRPSIRPLAHQAALRYTICDSRSISH